MESYLATLLDSELPLDAWMAVLIWALLFVANHALARLARAATDAQKLIVVEDWGPLRRGFEPPHMLAQVLFAGILFFLGFLLGRHGFAFFAGGLIVARSCAVGLNVTSVYFSRSMAEARRAQGSVTLSTALALRHAAQRLSGSALACLLIGLAPAHLAPLGGACLLGSGALGSVRRARKYERPRS